jgi:hypothetical protein
MQIDLVFFDESRAGQRPDKFLERLLRFHPIHLITNRRNPVFLVLDLSRDAVGARGTRGELFHNGIRLRGLWSVRIIYSTTPS